MGAWSYSLWGQWELCHQLQWEQDGALTLLLHWNGVQAHPLPRCGLLSFYSCSMLGFDWKQQLHWILARGAGTAWPDQVGLFQQSLMKYQMQEGHATTASSSLPWLRKVQPAAPLHGCILLDHSCSDLSEVNPGSILPSYGCFSTAAKLSQRS